MSTPQSTEQPSDVHLYSLVLEFVADEHGEDSQHYAEMKAYAAQAIQDDRIEGPDIRRTANLQAA